MDKKGYVYILTNKSRTTFYIGVTCDLLRRVYEHKNHSIKGFTSKYNVVDLIYFEEYNLLIDAIKREKQLKGWRREKKLSLVKESNPTLEELKFE